MRFAIECHLWYFPPPDAVQRMASYCAENGEPDQSWPYFSLDGVTPFDAVKWERMRSKWTHVHGLTNVWQEPPVHGVERVKNGEGYLHANQKPLRLMELQVLATTDAGDVVWEPFGGLCSASYAAAKLGRRGFAAELYEAYYEAAVRRLRDGLAAWRQGKGIKAA